ncbi:MAG: alpha/beta hydrolase [Bacteroidota bacterium]
MIKKLIIIIIIISVRVFLASGQNEPPKMPDGYRSNTTLKIAYAFGTLKLVDKEPPVPKDIIKYSDLVYKKVGDRRLKLDIYHRKNINKPAPLLIFIHGGAWKKGDRDDYRKYLIDFANKGYVTATITYRLSEEAKFPAAVNDVKCAVKWLKFNAEKYFINPDKIAVIGGSAGGHLAMMIGYSSDVAEFKKGCGETNVDSRVQVVVNLYGPSDLRSKIAKETSSVQEFIGKSYDKAPVAYKKATPLTYLSKDDPPTLIFHGTLDELVPVEQSDILNTKLKNVGIVSEYHKLKGWPHTMDLGKEVNEYCQYYMNRFFEKYIPMD